MAGRAGRSLRPRHGESAPALCARHVPLSFGQRAYGACAGLCDFGCGGAVVAVSRVRGASSARLGRLRAAGGECRDPERGRSGRLDRREHRQDESRAVQPARPVVRSAARDQLRLARVLQMDAVAVSAALRPRAGLSRRRLGQLGPGGPDGARQRAGDRRARLAIGRAGRAAAVAAMVHPHHRLRAAALGRAGDVARQMVGRGDRRAEGLDRPQRGGRDRLSRRRRGREGACAATPPAPIRCSGSPR